MRVCVYLSVRLCVCACLLRFVDPFIIFFTNKKILLTWSILAVLYTVTINYLNVSIFYVAARYVYNFPSWNHLVFLISLDIVRLSFLLYYIKTSLGSKTSSTVYFFLLDYRFCRSWQICFYIEIYWWGITINLFACLSMHFNSLYSSIKNIIKEKQMDLVF